MPGKTVFLKTCFINKLYKYKWHVTFFNYQHTSCIKQQKYQMHVHISLLSVVMKTIQCHLIYIILSWALDINLNKIANYTSGCIYHLDPVLVCIQIWVGQHAQTIGLFPLLAHFLQKTLPKTFHSPYQDKLKIDMESPLHTFYVTCKQTYPYNA